MRVCLVLFTALAAGLCAAGGAMAQESPCVIDAVSDALISVDPVTGDRTVVSGCIDATCTSIVGTGPNFQFGRGIYFEPDSNILVVDGDLDAPNNLKTLFRVNQFNGDRAVVSSSDPGNEVGTGPAFNTLFDVILATNGDAIVSDTVIDTIFRVDPVSGDRVIVSSNTVGTGPTMTFPGDMELETPGVVLVTEGGNDQVLRIDLATGNRTIVSSSKVGSVVGTGISFGNLGGITREPNGYIHVVDQGAQAVIGVDPISGNRTEVSGPTVGTGPLLIDPFGVDLDSAGFIFVSDGTLGLVKIDPATGNRVIHSSASVGTGIPILNIRDVRMEPSQIPTGVPLGSPFTVVMIAMLIMTTAAVMLSRRMENDVSL